MKLSFLYTHMYVKNDYHANTSIKKKLRDNYKKCIVV